MPASYRNIINTNALANAITTGDFSDVLKKDSKTLAKYIKGYAEETAIEALADKANINTGLFKQAFGIKSKELDAYDPYHTSDAKKEDFWNDEDGKAIQNKYDENTNTFKRSLYENAELGGYRQTDFWYEDPTYPMFELFFDDDSPLFSDKTNGDTLKSFFDKYTSLEYGYYQRGEMLTEFKKVFFKLFETSLNANPKNKSYYITKISGLEKLNKKITTYGEDKVTITLNEDVSYLAYYISELYNNIVYSYSNKRHTVPENVIRFDVSIKINDIRKFQIPEGSNQASEYVPNNSDITNNKNIKNAISTPSNIIYTLHDCTFDFFESRNHNDEIEIGGYGAATPNSPSTLSFNIIYKSVTRASSYPLIDNSLSIEAWEPELFVRDQYIDSTTKIDTLPKYFKDLERIKSEEVNEPKGYLNALLSKGAQTVANAGFNYADALETRLREAKGSAVNSLLNQFRSATNINKIEPDNVYSADYNNRASVKNAAKAIGSSLLNELEDAFRDGANF